MTETQTNTDQTPDVQTKAAAMGWTDREHWKGDPEKWVDADTYLEHGEKVMPILKANNQRLISDITGLRSENQTLKTQMADMQENMKVLLEANKSIEKARAEETRADLRRAIEDARKENDTDRVVELSRQLDGIKDPESTPTKKATPTPNPMDDPAFQRFITKHADWLNDPLKVSVATGIGQTIRMDSNNAHLLGDAFYDEVERRMNEFFREPTKPGKVEGGSGNANRNFGGKTYNDLPPDAKAACDRYAKRLKFGEGQAFKNEDEWRANYVKKFFE